MSSQSPHWEWDEKYQQLRAWLSAQGVWVLQDGTILSAASQSSSAASPQRNSQQSTALQFPATDLDAAKVPWAWDETYGQRRFWHALESCWILEDGRRLTAESMQQWPMQSDQQRTAQQAMSSSGYNAGSAEYYHASNVSAQDESEQRDTIADWSAFRSALLQLHSDQSTAPVPQNQPVVQRNLQIDPYGRLAVPSLRELGVPSQRMLKETPGDKEELDPRFYKRNNPKRFFKVGKVFKIWWPEHAGDVQDGITIATDPRFGEPFVFKIRWFVVVREDKDSCACLPIQTYRFQGLGKKGVDPAAHAVIYTGATKPGLDREEKKKIEKRKAGKVWLPAIRVEPREEGSSLHKLSRVNYKKVYTVEHYVKAFDFGQVHKKSEASFVRSFQNVWKITAPAPDEGDAESSDEEGDDVVSPGYTVRYTTAYPSGSAGHAAATIGAGDASGHSSGYTPRSAGGHHTGFTGGDSGGHSRGYAGEETGVESSGYTRGDVGADTSAGAADDSGQHSRD